MVGEERGQAAEQRQRLSKEEKREQKLEKFRQKLYKEADNQLNANMRRFGTSQYKGDENYARTKAAKQLHKSISKSIKNMTLDDLQTERRARRGERALQAIVGLTALHRGVLGVAANVAVTKGATDYIRASRKYDRIGTTVNEANNLWKKYYKPRQVN